MTYPCRRLVVNSRRDLSAASDRVRVAVQDRSEGPRVLAIVDADERDLCKAPQVSLIDDLGDAVLASQDNERRVMLSDPPE